MHDSIIYKMRTEKPSQMSKESMELLKDIQLAPYIQLSTGLIQKNRRAGGNMFRHQVQTLGILIDYGYIDPVLLKASVVHDVIEDLPDFDQNLMLNCDEDGKDVLKLVLEVTKRVGETKNDFLKRIVCQGSPNAKILKCADRISNMIELGFVTSPQFISKTCDDTEAFILPMALVVDYNMYQELISLLKSRMSYLESKERLD